MRPRDNPFRSERIESLAFRADGLTADGLRGELERLGGRGAIVGAEGSGKTTLLESLRRPLEEGGWRVHLLRFQPGAGGAALPEMHGRDALLVDGLESAGSRERITLSELGKRSDLMVATAHRRGLLPTLVELRTSPRLLRDLILDLVGEDELSRLEPELPLLFERHRGNLRACFRDLYDRWANRA